jgi:DNA-binding LacI/PurR family transcriptional regulator
MASNTVGELKTAPTRTPAAGGLPKHERLKREILSAIASGELNVGGLLPPESELAETKQMARNTVRQAMKSLEAMGVIRRTPGLGTMVIDNPASFRREKIGLYGLVLPELESPQYPSLQQGFNDCLVSTQGQMIVCDSNQSIARQLDVLMRLIENRVNGIVMLPVTTGEIPAYHLSAVRQLRLPLVFCHRRIKGVVAPLVTFSGYDVGFRAGRIFAELGHRRVLCWSAHDGLMPRSYRQGLEVALKAVGGFCIDDYNAGITLLSDLTEANRQAEIKVLDGLLKRKDRPTAVLASSDTEADRIWGHLESLGYRVPEDVSIISFGDNSRRSTMQQRLTSIVVDEYAIGKAASRLLLEICKGERPLDNDETIMIDVTEYAGESVSPLS